MQLDKGDRSILAYFPSSKEAQAAATKLKESGLVPESEYLQIDRVSRYGGGINSGYDDLRSEVLTLTGGTLYSGESGNEGPNPLLAAHDSVSGLGNPGAGVAGGSAFMVTLVTPEENVEQAVKIIKSSGGRV